MSDRFDRSMVKILAEILMSIEHADEGQVDDDHAVSLMEVVGAMFRDMSNKDRLRMRTILELLSDVEPDDERRKYLRDFSDGYGLSDN